MLNGMPRQVSVDAALFEAAGTIRCLQNVVALRGYHRVKDLHAQGIVLDNENAFSSDCRVFGLNHREFFICSALDRRTKSSKYRIR